MQFNGVYVRSLPSYVSKFVTSGRDIKRQTLYTCVIVLSERRREYLRCPKIKERINPDKSYFFFSTYTRIDVVTRNIHFNYQVENTIVSKRVLRPTATKIAKLLNMTAADLSPEERGRIREFISRSLTRLV